MRVIEVSMERHRNEVVGQTRYPRENPPTSGNVRHDPHMLRSGLTRPGPGFESWSGHPDIRGYWYGSSLHAVVESVHTPPSPLSDLLNLECLEPSLLDVTTSQCNVGPRIVSLRSRSLACTLYTVFAVQSPESKLAQFSGSSMTRYKAQYSHPGTSQQVTSMPLLYTCLASSLTKPKKMGAATTRLPPRRTGFDFQWIRSRIFAWGNHAGRCRWSKGFLADLPITLPCIAYMTHIDHQLCTFAVCVGGASLATLSRHQHSDRSYISGIAATTIGVYLDWHLDLTTLTSTLSCLGKQSASPVEMTSPGIELGSPRWESGALATELLRPPLSVGTGADSAAPRRNRTLTSPSPLPGTRCARGCLLPLWESRECRQWRDLLASQTSSRLLEFPIRLTTMQECSGESGWRPKTLYILSQPSGRQSLTEAVWRVCASEVKCGRRLKIAGRRRARCSWLEWTRGCETDDRSHFAPASITMFFPPLADDEGEGLGRGKLPEEGSADRVSEEAVSWDSPRLDGQAVSWDSPRLDGQAVSWDSPRLDGQAVSWDSPRLDGQAVSWDSPRFIITANALGTGLNSDWLLKLLDVPYWLDWRVLHQTLISGMLASDVPVCAVTGERVRHAMTGVSPSSSLPSSCPRRHAGLVAAGNSGEPLLECQHRPPACLSLPEDVSSWLQHSSCETLLTNPHTTSHHNEIVDDNYYGDYVPAWSRSRSKGAIRATLTRTPSSRPAVSPFAVAMLAIADFTLAATRHPSGSSLHCLRSRASYNPPNYQTSHTDGSESCSSLEREPSRSRQVETAACLANYARTRQQNGVTGQQHVATPFANQSLVICLPAGSPANRESLQVRRSQYDVRLVPTDARSQSLDGNVHCNITFVGNHIATENVMMVIPAALVSKVHKGVLRVLGVLSQVGEDKLYRPIHKNSTLTRANSQLTQQDVLLGAQSGNQMDEAFSDTRSLSVGKKPCHRAGVNTVCISNLLTSPSADTRHPAARNRHL
ncbi:hypothetical protein PR048_003903 [Dryococelus australis]|uniref:Uncharacterized protein n=1 Tax=Dryococelus australis TaxID=614101 RepID=A0ABQ9IPD2_9NEOP|nr:hypothetical protein PR048_003903 [Dryococelus australis]